MQRSLRLHDSAPLLPMPEQSCQGGSGRTTTRSDPDATSGCDGRVSAISSANRARSRLASRVRQPIAGSGRQTEVLMSHGRVAFVEMGYVVHLK